MRQNTLSYRFVGVLILVSLAIAFLFTTKESYGQIPKPKVNKPVYLVAAHVSSCWAHLKDLAQLVVK